MTAAFEAFTTCRRGEPYKVGYIELVLSAESMWSAEGCAAKVAEATVIADTVGIHVRVRGTDRDHLIRVVDRIGAAVQAGHEIPTDDFPGAEAGEPEARWCAKHRDGWCAVAGDQEPPEGMDNVPTVCSHVVVFPGGFDHRTPTCPDCLTALQAGEPESEGTT